MNAVVPAAYLEPDLIVDSDHDRVIEYADKIVGSDGGGDPIEIAVKLYYAVRDGFLYDPYTITLNPEDYRASNTLKRGRGFCVHKAVLLCALGRVCNIPSRLGFATVKNHLASKKLIEYIGSKLFVFHGYTEFLLNGKWVTATPAFNATLCERHHVAPLEFNGREDSVFQPYNTEKQLFMEYTEYYGSFPTVPMTLMVETWEKIYGRECVLSWFDPKNGRIPVNKRDFYKEEPLKH